MLAFSVMTQTKKVPLRLVEQSCPLMPCGNEGLPMLPSATRMPLRFVDGRPLSDITTQSLASCYTELERLGTTAWLQLPST